MSHLELYINQIKKLYPNITEDELNKMVEEFVADMKKQEGRYRSNELDGTYRETDKIKEEWVKVSVANE
jgi:hypothetical protein